MKQRNVQPLSGDGRQTGVGIAQHKIALRLQLGQKLIAATQNVTAAPVFSPDSTNTRYGKSCAYF